MDEHELWRELGQQLRVDAVRASAKAGSGHPTSSMSAADLAAVLLAAHFRYDFDEPRSPANDRLVFSKGHASPLVYGLFRAAGVVSEEEFLTYRQFGSRLEGHPTPVLPWVDVATGSLGQGLPIGVGMALAGKKLDRLPFRVWVICGDSEMAEGSMWEAVEHAAFYELDNLTAIVDVNRLGQRGETMHGWDLSSYSERFRAFGWHAVEIDGHDVEQIDAAYREAEATTGRPTAIVAKTIKGKGYSKLEDQGGWHGKATSAEDAEEALAEMGGIRNHVVSVPKPDHGEPHRFEPAARDWPRYEVGAKVSTRKAYGEALAALGGERGDVVALDGEVSNSTFAEIFRDAHPERFFEMYIAEQQMVAAAVGLQVLGWKPFCSTFAAFLSRAYDFVRMAAISRATLRLCGSHAGVSIGEDGPSQMGARGPGRVPGDQRLDRALPLRREPDRQARAGDGRSRRASRICARRARTRPCCTDRTTSSRSAARGRYARETTSRSWRPGSPCTRRCRQRTRSRRTASRRGWSTATRSSRSTRTHCSRSPARS